MTTPRRTPSAPKMRRYFEQTGFCLCHRGGNGKPEAWWLADNDGTPYPMPADWRTHPGNARDGRGELAEFSTLPRLWRAWAATQHRFLREARCLELIRERLIDAPFEERQEVARWVRLEGMPFELSGTEVVEVDETRWPWSAIRWVDGQMEGMGWPWSTIPESPADGLSVQRREGWAEEALVLHWFDMHYDASYFQAVAAVLDDRLPKLSDDGEVADDARGEAGGADSGSSGVIDATDGASLAAGKCGTSSARGTLH